MTNPAWRGARCCHWMPSKSGCVRFHWTSSFDDSSHRRFCGESHGTIRHHQQRREACMWMSFTAVCTVYIMADLCTLQEFLCWPSKSHARGMCRSYGEMQYHCARGFAQVVRLSQRHCAKGCTIVSRALGSNQPVSLESYGVMARGPPCSTKGVSMVLQLHVLCLVGVPSMSCYANDTSAQGEACSWDSWYTFVFQGFSASAADTARARACAADTACAQFLDVRL